MREIVLDTETTGLDPGDGHRLVEIACVELLNGAPSGASFHVYINPQREVPEEAYRIHGLSTMFLSGQPLFVDVVDEFLEFIASSRLVIHNADFDLKFLNSELEKVDRGVLSRDRVLDSLVLARRKFPGASNSLDALCSRFRIDASRRVKHGALVDAQLLAEVYCELTGGRQSTLSLLQSQKQTKEASPVDRTSMSRLFNLLIERSEFEAHSAMLSSLSDQAIWRCFTA